MTATKVNKAAAIREMIKANPQMSTEDLAKKAGVKLQYIHSVKYLMKKANSVAKKRGRPRKDKPVPQTTPLYEHQHQQIRSLRKEIEELTIVIAYLEHRVKQAEAKRAASV